MLPKRHPAVLGCGQFLPFIIKRILGIKHIFPCSFGNKRMHLLTCVYGIAYTANETVDQVGGLIELVFKYEELRMIMDEALYRFF